MDTTVQVPTTTDAGTELVPAAVVTAFGRPPEVRPFPVPAPRADTEVVVDVLADGLHPRVRSQADGSHYTSSGSLPLVPGIDGVGRAPDGTLRYFVLPETTLGTMARRTVVDLRRSIVLPEGTDPVPVAAAMNPVLSSWVALRRRVAWRAGQSVLVLGATGNAGRVALGVARRLGAGTVIGAGRGPRLELLPGLGADRTVDLAGDPAEVADRIGAAAAEVDVVLDYLWGEPAAAAMAAIARRRVDEARPVRWVAIGSVAGSTAPVPSAALRAVALEVVGSGQGSVPTCDLLAELPEMAAEITAGTFRVDARPVPLSEVTTAWADRGTDRIVVMP
nr:zinc-binding alcohol dehydrogenase family protein [Nakamurella endophytica]